MKGKKNSPVPMASRTPEKPAVPTVQPTSVVAVGKETPVVVPAAPVEKAPAAEPASTENGPKKSLLIDIRQVVKDYAIGGGVFRALKGVSLTVEPGEFVGVIGKSGCGKSTLINMITGIDRPSGGEVWVAGTPVHTLSEGQIAVWRGKTVGVVFQFFQLLPTLSVIENVMLPMDFCNLYKPRERRERALALLTQMEMDGQADKLPSALSGGQQQRVAIARALSNDPPILVADEPTGNLDSATAKSVFKLFYSLVDQGKTIVMVTHDSDLARRVSRVVRLLDGEIVEQIRQTPEKGDHA